MLDCKLNKIFENKTLETKKFKLKSNQEFNSFYPNEFIGVESKEDGLIFSVKVGHSLVKDSYIKYVLTCDKSLNCEANKITQLVQHSKNLKKEKLEISPQVQGIVVLEGPREIIRLIQKKDGEFNLTYVMAWVNGSLSGRELDCHE
ncbi:MAG: hypothetical protein ACOYL6_06295 [Bacteriovoracaceae bacterium]